MGSTRTIGHATLLRFWREEVLRLSLRAAARRLGTGPATVWEWETGATRPRLDPFTIDRRLGGDGVLGGMLWAVNTPDGLLPATTWSKVFRRGAPATWMWVRAADPSLPLAFKAEWGFSLVEFTVPPAPDGSLYWVPLSMPELPLVFTLSRPGWVDFGQGRPPSPLLHLPVTNAAESATRVRSPSRALGDLANQASTAGEVKRRSRLPERLTATLFSPHPDDQRPDWIEIVPAPGRPPAPTLGPVDRNTFRRLREARNVSYRHLSDRLADRLDVEVSPDTIRRFETVANWKPRFTDLDAALDEGLDAGGHLAVRPVKRSTGTSQVDFPPTWLGPVWLAFDEVADPRVVRLTWGRWAREIEVRSPAVVTMHCLQPHEPLHVETANTIHWQAGLGHRPGAQSIDQNWSPTDQGAARQIRSLALERVAAAFEIPRDRVRRLFRF